MGISREYLTVTDLAERYHRTPQTITAWRKAGKGPKAVKIHGRILYPVSEVLRYEREELGDGAIGDGLFDELDRFAKLIGLHLGAESIRRLGRVITSLEAEELNEDDGASVSGEGTLTTGHGVA